eukprot:TRINITY_DN6932_c0_g1_i1.p1 TRINITY_DN6932_c0_g1~~TRINITY_DN6932_c0_g1_i1.p1  ORF type:complete len:290 (-),score=40.80 TRINITY_DN6932_c0_g1_i1:237-1106(-)
MTVTLEWYTWVEVAVQAATSVLAFHDYFKMVRKNKDMRWYSLRAMILFCCGWLMLFGVLMSIFNDSIGELTSCLAETAIGALYHTWLYTTVYLLVLYYFWQIYCYHSRTHDINKPYWLVVMSMSLGLAIYVVVGHYLSCNSSSPSSTGNGTVLYQTLIGLFFIVFLMMGLGLFYLIRVRLGNIILQREHHFVSSRFFSVILIYLPFFLARIGTSIWALVRSSDTNPSGWGYALWVLIVDACPTIALVFSFRYYEQDLTRVDEARYEINYETDEEAVPIAARGLNPNFSV